MMWPILLTYCSFLRVVPLGGWGGPEKDQVLLHCLVHGLAIICHLSGSALGTHSGLGSGLIGFGVVFVVRDPIVMWGQFQVNVS